MAKEESDRGTIDDLDINQISSVIQSKPELAKSIRVKLKDSLSKMLNGAAISDDQLEAIRTDPSWTDTFNQLVRESILEHQDEILQYAK
jgi:23S rRNA A1618 N6-methylase RlmF